MLLERLKPDTIVWNKRFLEYRDKFSGGNEVLSPVEVEFTDGEVVKCVSYSHNRVFFASNDLFCRLIRECFTYEIVKQDLLVGADGVRSVVRQQRDLSEKAVPNGLEYIGISVIIGMYKHLLLLILF
jgi:hypothetical protein